MNKETKRTLAARIAFVGCQFCGETDMTLRNYGTGKICPRCLKARSAVPNSDTGKENDNG